MSKYSNFATAPRRTHNEKQQRVLRFRDIPFPSSGADFLRFLISSQGPFRDDENGRKRAKRELAKRWHPDKFAQNFSRQLKEEDREDIMEIVKEIYQSGTALMNTLSWDGLDYLCVYVYFVALCFFSNLFAKI